MKNDLSVSDRRAVVMDPSPAQACLMAEHLKSMFGCEVVSLPPPLSSAGWCPGALDIAVVEPWTGVCVWDTEVVLRRTRKVLVFTACPCPAFLQKLVARNVLGLISKNCTYEELNSAIESVLSGEHYIQSSILREVCGSVSRTAARLQQIHVLPQRQQAVLSAIARGRTMKDLADELGISVKTAEAHRRRLYDRFSVNNEAALTRLALQFNIIPLWDEED
jgi:DNA-binding CsgD family transcriptional regulator